MVGCFLALAERIKRNDRVVNVKVSEARPWYVIGKYTGMIIVRREIKVGKMIALTTRQLKEFELWTGHRKQKKSGDQ